MEQSQELDQQETIIPEIEIESTDAERMAQSWLDTIRRKVAEELLLTSEEVRRAILHFGIDEFDEAEEDESHSISRSTWKKVYAVVEINNRFWLLDYKVNKANEFKEKYSKQFAKEVYRHEELKTINFTNVMWTFTPKQSSVTKAQEK